MNFLEQTELEFRDPEAMAQDLLNADSTSLEISHPNVTTMCLEIIDGYFLLRYEGAIPGQKSTDWIGLYANEHDPWKKWKRWRPAKKGRSFHSWSYGNTSGYEARYYTWDNAANDWRLVRRSGPLTGQCK